MEFDLSPRVTAAQVDLARSIGAHLLFRERGADAKGRASTALALHAMTREQKRRLAGHLRAQRTARTMRDPGHRQTPILGRSPVGRTWDNVSVSSSAARGNVNSLCISAPVAGRSPTRQEYSSEMPLGSLK